MSVQDCSEIYTHFADAMRRHVGRGRRWSVAALAAATGYCDSMIAQLRSGERKPNLEHVTVIQANLGTPFINDMLAFHGHHAARPVQPCEVRALDALAAGARAAATAAEAVSDGVITHDELRAMQADAARFTNMVHAVPIGRVH